MSDSKLNNTNTTNKSNKSNKSNKTDTSNKTLEENYISFTDNETGEEIVFEIIEQTRVNGTDYILAVSTDENEEEGDAYIFKDVSDEKDILAVYEIVEDDEEFDAVVKIFKELLENVDFE